MRFFYSKRGSFANVRFSVFCPVWRLASLVRTVSYYGPLCGLREYIVKPSMKDGSVVSFLLQSPISSVNPSDVARDSLMQDYGYFRNRVESVISPQSLHIDGDVVDFDDLPF